MPATLVTKGTRYACHGSYIGDHICLPQFLMGTRYACHASNKGDQICLPRSKFLIFHYLSKKCSNTDSSEYVHMEKNVTGENRTHSH